MRKLTGCPVRIVNLYWDLVIHLENRTLFSFTKNGSPYQMTCLQTQFHSCRSWQLIPTPGFEHPCSKKRLGSFAGPLAARCTGYVNDWMDMRVPDRFARVTSSETLLDDKISMFCHVARHLVQDDTQNTRRHLGNSLISRLETHDKGVWTMGEGISSAFSVLRMVCALSPSSPGSLCWPAL